MPLQIHITAGSRKGQRLLADGHPVSFGREADNAVVVDLPEVSRKHGELTPQPDGSWTLANLSPNGTLVGGRRATNKPLPLHGDVSIQVGGTEILRLLAPAAAATGAEEAQAATAPPRKGNLKLWLGIVCGISTVLILFSLLAPVFSKHPESTAAPAVQTDTWSRQTLHAMVTAPPAIGAADPAAYAERLQTARGAYVPGRTMTQTAWLKAYRAYRLALSSNQNQLDDPSDRNLYATVLEKVEETVWADYQDACLAYNRRDGKMAGRLFDKILAYADGEDPLFGGKFRDHLYKLKGLAQSKAAP